MDFNKEILLCFSEEDNQPIEGGLKGWVSNFHKFLSTLLSQISREIPTNHHPQFNSHTLYLRLLEKHLYSNKIEPTKLSPSHFSGPLSNPFPRCVFSTTSIPPSGAALSRNLLLQTFVCFYHLLLPHSTGICWTWHFWTRVHPSQHLPVLVCP